MISLEKCEAYLNECQALGAEGKLTLRRATAVMAVCHAWLALSDAVREYETIVGEEDAPQAPLETRCPLFSAGPCKIADIPGANPD